jgi:hypothetical protein
LNGAVAVPEYLGAAFPIAKYLHFHVARGGVKAFQIQGAVSERRLRFSCSLGRQLRQFSGIADEPDAAPAAAVDGLDQQRVSEGVAEFCGSGRVIDFNGDSHRDAGRDRDPACAALVTDGTQRFWPRAGEGNTLRLKKLSELGLFTEKPIARMDHVCTCVNSGFGNILGPQVRPAGLRRSYDDDPIRQARGKRVGIGGAGGEHGAGADPPCRSNDAHGDFAPVGHQDYRLLCLPRLVHGDSSSATTASGWPNSTWALSAARNSVRVPAVPAVTGFISFITSMMPIVVSGSTAAPGSTKGGAPGEGLR